MDPSGAELYQVTWRDRIAEIRLTCGKANALNPRSLEALSAAFEEAVQGDACGVVLAGYDRFFSSGLDLVTLYDVARLEMDAFIRDFDRVMLHLFAYPRPVVAAVNGHAIAGGCILALACDARLATDRDVSIGLNEIRLGLPFPGSALEIARHAVPGPRLSEVLYGGRLYGPPEAMARGLVDEVGESEVLGAAHVLARRLADLPSGAFETLKTSLRAPALRRARDVLDPLRRAFVDAWFSPEARRRIGEARARFLA